MIARTRARPQEDRDLLGGDRGRQRRRSWSSAGSSRTGRGGRAILETVELKRPRFGDVDAAFAHDEGEGDRSLADWRQMHATYFTRRGEFSPDMELYCERFTLIEVLEGERRGDVAV
jgi:hypothetical protein